MAQSERQEEKCATRHGAMARTIFYVPPLAVARARRDAVHVRRVRRMAPQDRMSRAVVRSTLCASAFAAGSYRVALRITKRLTLDAPSLGRPPRLPPWPGPLGKNAGETRSAVLTPTVAKLVEGRRDREEGKHERPYTDHPQHLCNPDDPRRCVDILSIGSSLTPLRASRGHSCSTPFLLRFRPPRLNDLPSGLRAAPDSASARTYQPREARTRAALRGSDGSIDLQC